MKINTSPLIVVDADAIVAQAYPSDTNFTKATKISQYLKEVNARILYPVTALTEAITVLQRKLNSNEVAYGTALTFATPNLYLIEVNQEIYAQAVNTYFHPQTSKKNTLFDGIIAIIAKQHKANAIFSFDHFYKAQGFSLAEELLH